MRERGRERKREIESVRECEKAKREKDRELIISNITN